MSTKQQLHELVDRLPDAQVKTVFRIISSLLADPAILSVLAEPYDEEGDPEQPQNAAAEPIDPDV